MPSKKMCIRDRPAKGYNSDICHSAEADQSPTASDKRNFHWVQTLAKESPPSEMYPKTQRYYSGALW